MNKHNQIENAYAFSKNFYDTVMTQKNIFTKLYAYLFWSGTDDRKVAERILSRIPDDFHGKILDIPAGTAVLTEHKWRSLKHAEITCLDYSMDMLKQAEQRLSDCPHIKFVQGDAANLSMTDEIYDLVISMNGFHAFSAKQKAFSEMQRVLKPDGVFTGCFYIRGKSGMTDFMVNQVLSRKGWFTPPFQTEEEVRNMLNKNYRHAEIETDGSILIFHCRKPCVEKKREKEAL